MRFPLYTLIVYGLLSSNFADEDIDTTYDPISEDGTGYTYVSEGYTDPSSEYNYDATTTDDYGATAESRTVHIDSSDDEDDATEGASGSGDIYDYGIPEEDRFYCDHDFLILNKHKRCDGVADCGDCSDELDCPSTFNKLLSCYNEAPDKDTSYHPSSNPYCVKRHTLCNKQINNSCSTGLNQRNTGFGAKCFVKRQQQSCVLPTQVLMDNVVDCENGADEFKGIRSPSSSQDEISLAERPYGLGDLEKENMFKCLSDDQIYIFKNQLCDGTLDCPDFSDECLCHPIPERTIPACKLIQPKGWRAKCDCNEPGCPDATCDCNGGQLRVKTNDRHMCVASVDICRMQFIPEVKEMCALTVQQRSEPVGETVICAMRVDAWDDLTPGTAVKCDGNPECYYGEDECMPECKTAGVYPGFCKFWTSDVGYTCEVCNGRKDCFNGTDELGCPDPKFEKRTFVKKQTDHCSYDDGSNQNQIILREKLAAQGCDVSARQLWDGTKHCSDGADECPHFFTQPSSESMMRSRGISSYDHVIENSNTKNFVSVCGAIGVLTNMVAIVMCLVKWRKVFVSHRDERDGDSAVVTLKLLHEGGFSFSLAVSKLCLSCYLFTVVTFSPHSSPYCASDLQWRSGSTCSLLGSLVMLTVPVGAYGAFLMSFILFIVSSFSSLPTAHRTFLFQFLVSVAFIALLWVPLALMVMIGPGKLVCHAWLRMDGTQLRALANIVDRPAARKLISCVSGFDLGPTFSWPGFVAKMHEFAPGYHTTLIGTLGYYSHSAACLPLYLATAHPVSGCESESLSTFIVATLCFLCLSSLTLGILVMRRKLQPLADLALPTVWFAVIETACFFPIACLFLLGITSPTQSADVTDRVYQSGTLIIIALNATIFTPCLEFVKFFFGHKIAALGGKPKDGLSALDDDSRMLDSPKRGKSDDEGDVAGAAAV